jgi:hypothetical protein
MRNVLDFINQIYRVYVYPVNYGNINREIDLDKLRITDIIDTGVELGAEPLCTAAYQGGIALEDNSIFEDPEPELASTPDVPVATIVPPVPVVDIPSVGSRPGSRPPTRERRSGDSSSKGSNAKDASGATQTRNLY